MDGFGVSLPLLSSSFILCLLGGLATLQTAHLSCLTDFPLSIHTCVGNDIHYSNYHPSCTYLSFLPIPTLAVLLFLTAATQQAEHDTPESLVMFALCLLTPHLLPLKMLLSLSMKCLHANNQAWRASITPQYNSSCIYSLLQVWHCRGQGRAVMQQACWGPADY